MNTCRRVWPTALALALAAFVALLLAAAPQPVRAAGPWYVALGGSDSNDCLSPGPTHACASINGALAKATAGDTIRVAIGTYTGTDDQVVLLDKNATLSGGWNSGFTAQSGTSTIDGQGARRGMTVNSGVIAIVGHFTVQNSSWSGNGGGVYNNGTLTLNNSTVNNNTAAFGGGIYNMVGTLTLNNSTISGNSASNGSGGGIYTWWDSTAILNSSTVNGNKAFHSGGGIHNNESNSTLTLNNSVVSGNATDYINPDCTGPVSSTGYNLIGNTSGCTFSPTTGDLTNVDPRLSPLEGSPGYHPLLPDSPAVNAGNPAGCKDDKGNPLTADQRGFPRFGRCDIGAYELQPLGFSTKSVNQSTATPGVSLTYTIVLTNGSATAIANVRVTDTLPIYLTYRNGSLTATGGSYGYKSGVITWTGVANAGNAVTITFGTMVNPTLGSIVNSAIISGGGEVITRTATVTVENEICNLTKHPGNPVLSVGASGSWDDDDVWSPAVLKEGGGYKMWYTGDDGSNPSRIGLATSTNGITWTKAAVNPILLPVEAWETGGIRAGGVISDSGLYKMWYTGFDSGGVGRIGYATSPDGVAWTKYGSNPVLDIGASGSWEDDDVLDPTMIKEGSTYHMWYWGYDGITDRIGHATSNNGTTWTRDPANPVLDIGSPGAWDWLHTYGPSVIRYNDMFLMWYSGGTLPQAWQTGYALSSGGSAWIRGEMLIPEGATGAFDADSADYPSALADGEEFKVWYSGLNAGGTYNVGYATAEVCGAAAPPANPVYLPIVLKGGSVGPSCPAYYADDFSDSGSGWSVDDNSDRRFAYTGGQYQIWLKKPSLGWSVSPGAKATDFTVAVSARRASGSSGGYGIVFGINEDWSQRYEFDIGVNNYSIWKYDGSWTALRNWTTSSYVGTGTNWNRLKVIRSGASIAVYVNDHYLTTVTDGSFTGLRRIGLAAYSPSSAALDARFDDFALYPADCGVSAASAGFEMGKPEIHQGPVPPGLDQAP